LFTQRKRGKNVWDGDEEEEERMSREPGVEQDVGE